MQVSVEEVPELSIGTKGILIRIRDDKGKNLGKLRIGKATVKWAKGRVPEKNAKNLSVSDFVDYLNKLP